MILNIGNIKLYHENSIRLNILDHAILCLLQNYESLILYDLHKAVNREYRQTNYQVVKRTLTKLIKYKLVTYDVSMSGYVVTADGKKELNKIIQWVDSRAKS